MHIPPRLIALTITAQGIAADATALLVRLTIGQAFVLTGLGKLRNLDRTTEFFTSLGIPMPGFHAVAIGSLELIGGALLVIGLAVRPMAVLLVGTMAAAILTADRADFAGALALAPDKGLTDVVPWMFALLLCGLAAHGGGRVSIDRLLAPVWRQWTVTPAVSG
jgi:putative oxidoreductase